jgi:hypothetical protein
VKYPPHLTLVETSKNRGWAATIFAQSPMFPISLP